MDFFEHQKVAARRTAWLLLLFALAVAGVVAGLYLTLLLSLWAWGFEEGAPPPALVLWQPKLAAGAVVAAVLLIGGGAMHRRASAGTGEGVARLLGGRPLGDTDDPALLRLRNVVEEMALAAGMAAPTIFVLEDEAAINAFAAGTNPGNAVVAVTRGCLDHLSRDELQGVIAHEFSHIVNGDSKRNLDLVSLLYGILVVGLLGRALLRGMARGSRHRRYGGSTRGRGGGGAGAVAILGAGLLVAGSVGWVVARLIKAAVSRQREYLADAAGVQFTRNPQGLVGALKKIGGATDASVLGTWHAEEASHMFFGNGVSGIASRLAATHPPLVERIRRIDSSFDGTFPLIVLADSMEALETKDKKRMEEPREVFSPLAILGLGASRSGSAPSALGAGGGTPDLAATAQAPIAVLPRMIAHSVGRPSAEHLELARGLRAAIPAAVDRAVHDPCAAAASMCALLIDRKPELRERQLEILIAGADPAVAAETRRLLPEIERCHAGLRLPIVDLALPALRRLSPAQYVAFRRTLRELASADAEIDLLEFTLHRILLRHLDPHFGGRPSPPGRLRSFGPIAREIGLVLSSLAWLGHGEQEAAARALRRGLAELRSLDASMVLFPRDRCTLPELGSALDRATALSAPLRGELLAACAASIEHDRRVTVGEAECLRAIADYLDCPLPPMASADGATSARS